MSETEPASDESAQSGKSSDLFGGGFTTSEALKRIRKRLLHLTSRNRLLNFRWSKGRVLRVIDTVPDDLYRQLVIDGKTLTFTPVPDPPQSDYEQDGPVSRKPDVKKYAESLGININYELTTVPAKACKHVQSLHYPEDLERLLHKVNVKGTLLLRSAWLASTLCPVSFRGFEET